MAFKQENTAISHIICTLCNEKSESTAYDLRETFASFSKTLLVNLIEESIGSCITPRTSTVICTNCFILLNELDHIKLRTRRIEEQLKNYIKQSNASAQSILSKEETSTIEPTLKEQPHSAIDLDFDDIKLIPLLPPECNSSAKKTASELKPFQCTECSKTWRTSSELRSHLLSHDDKRSYICEICGQGYKRRQALVVHIGMHNGINPFTCVYCKKTFTQKGALSRHMPKHTGELPYQCDLCGKRFLHHTSFSIHQLTHSGEKSHKCDVCGLLLMSGSHLKRHMRVHTGEKKYACGTCGKKFAERYNLAVHEKLHSGNTKSRKHKCAVCNVSFSREATLEEHLLAVHQKLRTTQEQLN